MTNKNTETAGEQLYKQDKGFAKMIDTAAAYNAHQSGQSIKEIAEQAGKSESTIRRYIKSMDGV